MKAVIMAGGQGTRLRSISEDLPKPMVPVLGKPILQYQIEGLRENGITDITIMTGYKAEAINGYFGDGSSFGVDISYVNEDHPMGTAGALYFLRGRIKEDFLLLMGDLMMSVDFEHFMDFHRIHGGLVTLLVHPNAHPYDSDVILTDRSLSVSDFTEDKCGLGREPEFREPSGLVTGVLSKNAERSAPYHNMVNSGVYALSARVLDIIPEPEGLKKTDLDKDIIRPLIAEDKVYAFHSTEYIKDMGTPERYEAVTRDLESGLIEARNLKNRQKCIFLDRDGTINEYLGLLRRPEELRLMEGVPEAIRLINDSEYLAIVVTNQPVIARGDISFEELDQIHAKLETEFGREGAYLDDIFFCPHHPDSGFESEVRELKFRCVCRKPGTGMIDQAVKRYNIDLGASYMIGDMTMDVLCGKNAGLRTVLLETGKGGSDGIYEAEPDMIAPDLLTAVRRILGRE